MYKQELKFFYEKYKIDRFKSTKKEGLETENQTINL